MSGYYEVGVVDTLLENVLLGNDINSKAFVTPFIIPFSLYISSSRSNSTCPFFLDKNPFFGLAS
jgi:hypothetical protein